MRRLLVLALGAVVLSAPGCGVRDCTDVGGPSGVVVLVPRDLAAQARSLRLEVCDDGGCGTATVSLARGWAGHETAPAVATDFHALGRRFDPGTEVTVTATLSRGGTPIAVREDVVEMTSHYPNGRGCDDDDDFVSASLRMTDDDQV